MKQGYFISIDQAAWHNDSTVFPDGVHDLKSAPTKSPASGDIHPRCNPTG
jgi:hypothetical protein